MKNTTKAHLALVAVNLLYGGNYIIAKEVTPAFIKPFGFIVIRVTMATMLFWLLHKALRKAISITKEPLLHKPIAKKDFPLLAACGLFGVGINQMMFFKGLSLTSPINASLIMITTPIMVLIFAAFIIKEKITPLKLLGIAVGTAGAAFLIIYGAKSGDAISNPLGDLCIFINACSYALYLVLVKPLMQRYHPFVLIKWVFFFGWFIIMPFGFAEFRAIEWQTFSIGIWMCVAYVVVGATFFTYFFNVYALGKLNPSVVSTYIYTQPLIATTIAVLLGKDALTAIKVLAAVFIFMGVYMVSKPSSN